MSLSRRATWVAFSILTLIFSLQVPVANASNGIQVIGPGPRALSMGGGSVADPATSDTALYLNPAGLPMLDTPYQTDLYFAAAFPTARMGSSLAPAGNPDAVNVGSTDDAAFFPGGSIVFPFFGSDKFSMGVGAIPSAGFQVEFPVSRFSNAITGNTYDNSGRYGNIKILPGFGYRILDNLSVGGAVDINYAFFETNSATLTPGFPQTAGRSRFDSTLGIGGRIGVLYIPIDMIQIGATYVFRSRFQAFDRYTDLIPTGLDLPRQVDFGVAIKPLKGMKVATDFLWINWSDAGFIGENLALGGAQWRDQYVFKGGLEYDFMAISSVPIAFRLGYNYGRSPITSETAFRNLLIPTVMEHHFTTGLGVTLGEHIVVNAAYIYEFGNTVTDNGTGNPTGAGSFVGIDQVHAFAVGITGKWGKKKLAPDADY